MTRTDDMKLASGWNTPVAQRMARIPINPTTREMASNLRCVISILFPSIRPILPRSAYPSNNAAPVFVSVMTRPMPTTTHCGGSITAQRESNYPKDLEGQIKDEREARILEGIKGTVQHIHRTDTD